MKKLIKHLTAFAVFAAVLLLPVAAFATDNTYTTLPQQADSELLMLHKVQAAQVGASNKYANITTATTTTVKTGSGIIERLVVNTGGASSVWVLYDNTAGSGTKIASGSSATQISLPYGARFATGLTLVTSTGTPADITVVYR